MAKDDFRCEHRLRVRWAEVDMQKVVFNGHYLTYIDTAIADYWRAIGLAYPEGYVDKYGHDMYLRKASVEYLGSARYEDELCVRCRAGKLGRSSMTFFFEIARERPNPSPDPLISAELVYVNVEVKTLKPVPLHDEVRASVRAYERTAPEES